MPRSLAFPTLLLLALLLPRLVALNRFVTDDERKWLVRSGNFYQALSTGDWENTFQREHPGVTVMWAGTAAFLWRYPAYVREVPGQLGWEGLEIEPFLRAQGHEPMELLAAGRGVLGLLIILVLIAAFVVAARLLGWAAALAGLGLVALDPFHSALSRLFHLDGLVSSLMLLAVLLALLYLEEKRRRWLLLSGLVAGLAVLTKSPALFLLPFVGLLFLLDTLARRTAPEQGVRVQATALVARYLPWLGMALLVFALLWPAVWVEPLATPLHMFDKSTDYAEGRHFSTIFFNGVAFEGDPGPTFYPTAFLWRTTPVVLAGLLLAALALLRGMAPLEGARARRTVGTLLLFVALYGLLITLGSKKLDRYALPLFPPLDIVAGVGWVAAAEALTRRGGKQLVLAGGLVVALGGQAWGTLATAPYYLTYYNPLLGGAGRAPQVMMVGRGEGMEEAARLLAERGAEAARVWVWNPEILAYHLPGELASVEVEPEVGNLRAWLALEYAVLYVGDWQRRLLPDALLDYFAQLEPEAVVWLNGLEYVRLYNLRAALPPDELAVGTPHFTEWGGAIRLVAYELPEPPLAPGGTGIVTFHLQNRAPLAQDLNVLVRLVSQDGQEVWRDEGWPFGSPTSTWQEGEIWPDGHELTLPADLPPGTYRLELSFYDPATFAALPATDPLTGEALAPVLVVEEVTVGN